MTITKTLHEQIAELERELSDVESKLQKVLCLRTDLGYRGPNQRFFRGVLFEWNGDFAAAQAYATSEIDRLSREASRIRCALLPLTAREAAERAGHVRNERRHPPHDFAVDDGEETELWNELHADGGMCMKCGKKTDRTLKYCSWRCWAQYNDRSGQKMEKRPGRTSKPWASIAGWNDSHDEPDVIPLNVRPGDQP